MDAEQTRISLVQKINVYDSTIVSLATIGLASILLSGDFSFLAQLVLLPLFSLIFDSIILYVKKRKFLSPKTAIITGLFLAMLLNPVNIYIMVLAPLIAILSKHIIKWKARNIFNPAIFSVLVLGLFSLASDFWWGANNTWFLFIPLGLFATYKIRRLWTPLGFFLAYIILFSAYNTLTGIPFYQSLFPFLGAFGFFSLFMLIEPKSSPYKKRGMLIYGPFVAVVMFTFSIAQISLSPLILPLLLGNLLTPRINKL